LTTHDSSDGHTVAVFTTAETLAARTVKLNRQTADMIFHSPDVSTDQLQIASHEANAQN